MKEFIKPKVGDGGTYYIGGDRYPFSVWKVSPSGKTIWVTEDGGNKKDGFKPNKPTIGFGRPVRLKFNDDGSHYYKGRGYGYYHIGEKDWYWDPHF